MSATTPRINRPPSARGPLAAAGLPTLPRRLPTAATLVLHRDAKRRCTTRRIEAGERDHRRRGRVGTVRPCSQASPACRGAPTCRSATTVPCAVSDGRHGQAGRGRARGQLLVTRDPAGVRHRATSVARLMRTAAPASHWWTSAVPISSCRPAISWPALLLLPRSRCSRSCASATPTPLSRCRSPPTPGETTTPAPPGPPPPASATPEHPPTPQQTRRNPVSRPRLVSRWCHGRARRPREQWRRSRDPAVHCALSPGRCYVREGGLEPPCPLGHTALNRARLPIPPLARGCGACPQRRGA